MTLNPTVYPGSGSGGVAVSLFSSTLGADAASIDSGAGGFATTSAVLDIFVLARTDEAVISSSVLVTLNGDSGANYDRVNIIGNAGAAASTNAAAQTSVVCSAAGNTAAANACGVIRIAVPGYGLTTFHKQLIIVEGIVEATSGSGAADTKCARWRNTAAVNRVTVTNGGGTVLRAGSTLVVLGIG